MLLESVKSDSAFPATRWSLIINTRDGQDDDRKNALAQLCEAYWLPAYAFVRRTGKSAEDAKDLTQGFFLDFLTRDTFSKADPQLGRMRSFLLNALKCYLAKSHAAATTLKRGNGELSISIESTEAEGLYLAATTDYLTPDLIFERRWASALFQRSFLRLRNHFAQLDKTEIFHHIKDFLAKDSEGSSYAEAARHLGLSEGNIGVTVFRMRQRFRKILEEEIRDTLVDENDFDDELRHIQAIFSQI